MLPSPSRPHLRRVVVPFSSTAVDSPLLRSAVRFASPLRAEVMGLFLRDERLLRGAAVLFSREVRRLPAALKERTSEDLERQVRAQIRRVETLLVQDGTRSRSRRAVPASLSCSLLSCTPTSTGGFASFGLFLARFSLFRSALRRAPFPTARSPRALCATCERAAAPPPQSAEAHRGAHCAPPLP